MLKVEGWVVEVAYEQHFFSHQEVECGYGLPPSTDVPGPDSSGEGTLACHLAGGTGLEQCAYRPDFRPQPSYDWGLARTLSPARPSRSGLRADRRFPPVLDTNQQVHLKEAVQSPPVAAGLELANWNWKVVREFIRQRFGLKLSRSSCLNYLHRLGFVLKRPKKRLLKADQGKRQAFIALYGALQAEALTIGAKIFFVDEAHFRADAELRGKWVLKGQSALVDSSSPSLKEKATYYSGVCLEDGEVEAMEVKGSCTAETSARFLKQLREKYPQPLIVVWDNAPAHHGEALREYLKMPGLNLRLVALPGYSPDFNSDEAIWDWAREEVTANTCLGTVAKVEKEIGQFFVGLSQRKGEVKSRCRTILQAEVAMLMPGVNGSIPNLPHAVPTLA